ncbi:spectrin beta chain, non-erythrocytic 1-like [Dysidea avara]|uniref:spectrin beta chain, non-erythrocytic 1-like n=1 Tax=Dysidea avara TaxID=196820 RepID=UPI00332F7CAA
MQDYNGTTVHVMSKVLSHKVPCYLLLLANWSQKYCKLLFLYLVCVLIHVADIAVVWDLLIDKSTELDQELATGKEDDSFVKGTYQVSEHIDNIEADLVEEKVPTDLVQADKFLDEHKALIAEKAALLNRDDDESDLSNVLFRQRRLMSVEREIVALTDKVNDFESEVKVLTEQHPEEATVIAEKHQELLSAWEDLKENLAQVKQQVGQSGNLKQLLEQLNDFISWLDEMFKKASSQDLTEGISEAEKAIKEHNELKVEILAQQSS